MLTRRLPALLLLTLVLAGCADNTGAGPVSAPASGASMPVSIPASQAPSVEPSGEPSGEPSAGKPTASGPQTISGTVVAGIEPSCLTLRDSNGSYVLFFDNPALRSAARIGARVTLVGRREPTMMTTCQQGVAFIVSAVRPG